VDFINNIYLVVGLVGGIVNLLAEVSDFINAAIAGSINFYNIQSPALGYCLAQRTGIARFPLAVGEAVHRLSQDASGAGFTCASGTVKKIGMRYPTTIEGIEQRLGYLLLPNHLSQGLGTPLAIKDLRSHFLRLLLYPILTGFPKRFFEWIYVNFYSK